MAEMWTNKKLNPLGIPGKTMGKPWENGGLMGKPPENHGCSSEFMGYSIIQWGKP